MIILLLLAIAQVIRVNSSDSTAGDDRRRSHSSALYCRGYGMVWLPHSAQHSVQVATTMTIRLGAGGTDGGGGVGGGGGGGGGGGSLAGLGSALGQVGQEQGFG